MEDTRQILGQRRCIKSYWKCCYLLLYWLIHHCQEKSIVSLKFFSWFIEPEGCWCITWYYCLSKYEIKNMKSRNNVKLPVEKAYSARWTAVTTIGQNTCLLFTLRQDACTKRRREQRRLCVKVIITDIFLCAF